MLPGRHDEGVDTAVRSRVARHQQGRAPGEGAYLKHFTGLQVDGQAGEHIGFPIREALVLYIVPETDVLVVDAGKYVTQEAHGQIRRVEGRMVVVGDVAQE